MMTTRGARQVALCMACVLVLLGFVLAVSWGLGHVMIAAVASFADNGS